MNLGLDNKIKIDKKIVQNMSKIFPRAALGRSSISIGQGQIVERVALANHMVNIDSTIIYLSEN